MSTACSENKRMLLHFVSKIEKGRIPQLTSALHHSAHIWTFPALFAGKLETPGTKKFWSLIIFYGLNCDVFLHGANAPMATVHIRYVCLLMVVLLFDLMITPLTPTFLPRHPVAPCLCHLMPWRVCGSFWGSQGHRADNWSNCSCHPRAADLRTPSEACWAEWQERCFHALLKCSHPWEEHSSSHWQDHQQHFLFQVHPCPQLGQGKQNVVSEVCSVPPRRDFLHHRDIKSIYFSAISTRVSHCLKMESS